jgi:hypothetical protein
MLQRFFLALSVALAALACITSASAGPAETFALTWSIAGPGATAPPADSVLPNCGGVPSGMWVMGSGTLTFFAPTGNGGNLNSTANGTAIDSAGNSYMWNYRQTVQPFGDGSHSKVVDDFVLSGSGPVGGLRSHFIAIIDGDSVEEATTFEPLLLKGDPFNCDPL